MDLSFRGNLSERCMIFVILVLPVYRLLIVNGQETQY